MKLNNTHRVIMLALERYGPMTIPQICEVACLNYRSLYNVSPNVVEQLKEAGEIHIIEWERQEGKGGLPKPIYALGKGDNAPYPGKKPLKEKYEISRLYNKARRTQKALQSRSITAIMLGCNPNMRRESKKPEAAIGGFASMLKDVAK